MEDGREGSILKSGLKSPTGRKKYVCTERARAGTERARAGTERARAGTERVLSPRFGLLKILLFKNSIYFSVKICKFFRFLLLKIAKN